MHRHAAVRGLPTVFDDIGHCGPLARTVADAALFLNVASGPLERDIQPLPDRVHLDIPGDGDVRGLSIALCVDLGYYALLCPTTSMTAPRHGLTDADFQPETNDGRDHGLDMTCPFNFVGQCPAVSVPAGLDSAGLPIGAQVVGRRYQDAMVPRIAAALTADVVPALPRWGARP